MKGKAVEEIAKWLVNKIWVSDSLAWEISKLQTAGKDHCIHTLFLQLHISLKDEVGINRNSGLKVPGFILVPVTSALYDHYKIP